jgi:hypothetical protein
MGQLAPEGQAMSEELKEYYEFLDELRESGETNMFGAAPYLAEEFGLSKRESREVVLNWMGSFAERHPTA